MRCTGPIRCCACFRTGLHRPVGCAALGAADDGSAGQPVPIASADRALYGHRCRSAHPLVQGIEPFDTTDELYHMERTAICMCCSRPNARMKAPASSRPQARPACTLLTYISSHGRGRGAVQHAGPLPGALRSQPMLDWWPDGRPLRLGLCRCFTICCGGASAGSKARERQSPAVLGSAKSVEPLAFRPGSIYATSAKRSSAVSGSSGQRDKTSRRLCGRRSRVRR